MNHAAAYTQYACLLIHRDTYIPILVTLLYRRQKMFCAIFYPPYRPAHMKDCRGDGNLFRVNKEFDSKAPSDVGGDDLEMGAIHAHPFSQSTQPWNGRAT